MDNEAVRAGSMIETFQSVWGRRKWLGVLVFTVPFVAAVSLIVFLPGVYRSTATVLVDRQQVPESMVRPTVTSALETRLHTIGQEILSRSRLDSLIKQFDLYSDLRTRVSSEEVIERMRKDIKLELTSVEQKEQRRGATIAFALSYDGRDPVTVARVTNTLASFFIEENLKVRERQASGTSEFLKSQLTDAKKRLDEQEALVSQFKKKYMGELPQQTDANLSAIERLNTQLRMNSDNQMRVQERREALVKQLGDAATLASGAAGPEGPAARLARLHAELRQLRTTYSDKYPDIARIKHEIATLEQEARDAAESMKDTKQAAVANPYMLRIKQSQTELEGELNVLRSEEKRLRAALASYVGRVENSPKREQEFRELARDYDSMRENYTSLMKRYEEAQLAESMEQRQKGEQFRLLDPAVPSATPTAPNRWRLLLGALVGCLALAVAVVVAAEQINASCHSVDDLRNLTTVPVLLSIPLIVTPDDTERQQRRMRLAAMSVAVGLLVIIGVSFFIAHGNEQLVALVSKGRM